MFYLKVGVDFKIMVNQSLSGKQNGTKIDGQMIELQRFTFNTDVKNKYTFS